MKYQSIIRFEFSIVVSVITAVSFLGCVRVKDPPPPPRPPDLEIRTLCDIVVLPRKKRADVTAIRSNTVGMMVVESGIPTTWSGYVLAPDAMGNNVLMVYVGALPPGTVVNVVGSDIRFEVPQRIRNIVPLAELTGETFSVSNGSHVRYFLPEVVPGSLIWDRREQKTLSLPK